MANSKRLYLIEWIEAGEPIGFYANLSDSEVEMVERIFEEWQSNAWIDDPELTSIDGWDFTQLKSELDRRREFFES